MAVEKVIITGAANGVGRELAKRCLDDGLFVIGCDIDEVGLKSLEAEYDGGLLETHLCDVGLRNECEEFMDKVLAKHDDVDGLVNNAGLYYGQPVWEYDAAMVDRVIAVNLNGPVWLSRRFAEHLLPKKRRGSIVNFASVAGEVGSSDALYGAVKAGVIGLTKSNAMNFAPYIRVNVVSPGLTVDTDIADNIPDYRYKEYKRQELLDGDVYPRDVADVCAYLLCGCSRRVTGSLLRADNGAYPR